MKYLLYIFLILVISITGFRLVYDMENIRSLKRYDTISRQELTDRKVFNNLLVCISDIFDVISYKNTTEMVAEDKDSSKVKIIFDEKLNNPYDYEGKCVTGNLNTIGKNNGVDNDIGDFRVLWVPRYAKPVEVKDVK